MRCILATVMLATGAIGQTRLSTPVRVYAEPDASAAAEIGLRAKTGTHEAGFKAPDSLSADLIFRLPSTDGSSGKCWGWASALVLDWVDCGGSGGPPSNMMTTDTPQDVTAIKTIQTAIGADYYRIHKPSNRAVFWQQELTSDGLTYRLSDSGPNIVLSVDASPTRYGNFMGTWRPTADATYDLGSVSYRWKDGRFSGTVYAALSGNASTATALAANPTDCGGGQFANAIDASGNLTCGAPSGPSNMMTTDTAQDVTGIKTIQTAIGADYFRVQKPSNRAVFWQQELSSDGLTYRLSDSGPNIVMSIDASPTRYGNFMGTWRPTADATYDLGSVSYRWKDGRFSGTVYAALSGNASTATALAADPIDCGGGNYAQAIDASGNLTCGTPPGGTVTSVGLSMPSQFAVTGSPVTSAGTLTAAWNNVGLHYFFLGPVSGSPTVPQFRAVAAEDLGGGTPSSATFLRGDLYWAAVPAPSNMMTTDTAQTEMTGRKTWVLTDNSNPILSATNSGAGGGIYGYTDNSAGGGYGVSGVNTTGPGVFGSSTGGAGGYFQSSTGSAVQAASAGSGSTISATNSGSGPAIGGTSSSSYGGSFASTSGYGFMAISSSAYGGFVGTTSGTYGLYAQNLGSGYAIYADGGLLTTRFKNSGGSPGTGKVLTSDTVGVGTWETPSHFTDRGDPGAYDKTVGDFTKDYAWHDWDLSGIVPAGAKAVVIDMVVLVSSGTGWVDLRRDGNANAYNISRLCAPAINYYAAGDMVVALSDDRKIEYRINTATWTELNAVVKGWW
jgi:hypothetical protein